MERETRSFKTPRGGNEVVIKSWLNGHEKLEFMDVSETKKPKVLQEKMLEVVLVSVDDDHENRVKKILDMHGADVDYVISELTKVMTDSTYIAGKKKE